MNILILDSFCLECIFDWCWGNKEWFFPSAAAIVVGVPLWVVAHKQKKIAKKSDDKLKVIADKGPSTLIANQDVKVIVQPDTGYSAPMLEMIKMIDKLQNELKETRQLSLPGNHKEQDEKIATLENQLLALNKELGENKEFMAQQE